MTGQYAVIVAGKEVLSADKTRVMAQDGERFWVVKDYWGDTSSRCDDPKRVPGYVKLFNSREEAEAFARSWGGHPWWCVPRKGQFEIVEIKPVYQQVVSGYARV